MLRRVVDPAVGLGHPQLHTVMLEQWRHRRVLAAVERPLVLPDHDRVPPPVRIRELSDQGGGLRAAGPRQLPGLPHVEEIRHDLPVAADQRLGLLPLPCPRRHRILPVLGRDPPVEHEPHHAAPGRTPVPAGGPLRPRHQGAPASPRLGVRGKRRGHHPSASPAPQEYPATPASPAEPVKPGGTPHPNQPDHAEKAWADIRRGTSPGSVRGWPHNTGKETPGRSRAHRGIL
jgi:hypothetical protein